MDGWYDYVLCRGIEVEEAWTEAAGHSPTLYILGEGFDPRALLGLERLLGTPTAETLGVLSLSLAPEQSESERGRRAAENVERIERLSSERGFGYYRLPYPVVHESRSAGRLIFQSVLDHEAVRAAGHVIVDVSALPTGVFFPLIAGLVAASEQRVLDIELQIVVAENVKIDGMIEGEGADAPTTVAGFKFDLELDPGPQRAPVIWAPVLGRGALVQLEAIRQTLEPDEVCPVLPFPSGNPRRADDLLLEVRPLVVDQLHVELANFIYADERNPFDLYRALTTLDKRYGEALEPLGGATLVVSIHSSKSLSLGALLAAHERRLPVMNAEPDHYRFELGTVTPELVAESELTLLWIAGTPFR